MKRTTQYLILLFFIYLILFTLKKSGVYIPLVSDYLADLIALPFSLGVADYLMNRFSKNKFEIGFIPMIVAVIYFSLVFEVWMPSISPLYTADIWDVICYLMGGIVFLVIQRKSKSFS